MAAIRAAATVFADKGFHGASTRDIADQLGIKQGSLYYYFDSKEEALEEVCLYGIRDYAEHMTSIANSEQDFAARLLAVITNHLTSYREKNEALKVHNDERLYLPPARRNRLKQLGSQYRRQLEAIIDEGKDCGALRADIDSHFVAQSIIGVCNALGELIVRDSQINIFDVVQKTNDLLLNGLAAAK